MPDLNGDARFPVDYDALGKGSVIPRDRLIAIIDARPDSPSFSLKVLALRQQIKRELADRGLIVSVALRRGDLCILADADAARYTARMHRLRRRGMIRNHREALAVDVANLNADEQAFHQHELLIAGRELAAAANARRTVRPVAHQRQGAALPVPAQAE
jgi:hypothetical protein